MNKLIAWTDESTLAIFVKRSCRQQLYLFSHSNVVKSAAIMPVPVLNHPKDRTITQKVGDIKCVHYVQRYY